MQSTLLVLVLIIILPILPIISQQEECVISCCVDCKDSCDVCYELNRHDKSLCPCIKDLSPRLKARLGELLGDRLGDRLGNGQGNTLVNQERGEKDRTAVSLESVPKSSNLRMKEKTKHLSVPVCKPSCCHNTSCTQFS